jgi:hypothetical protein
MTSLQKNRLRSTVVGASVVVCVVDFVATVLYFETSAVVARMLVVERSVSTVDIVVVVITACASVSSKHDPETACPMIMRPTSLVLR